MKSINLTAISKWKNSPILLAHDYRTLCCDWLQRVPYTNQNRTSPIIFAHVACAHITGKQCCVVWIWARTHDNSTNCCHFLIVCCVACGMSFMCAMALGVSGIATVTTMSVSPFFHHSCQDHIQCISLYNVSPCMWAYFQLHIYMETSRKLQVTSLL